MSDLYSDVASFGVLAADIRLIIMSVICVVLTIIGISILLQKIKRTGVVDGTVINSDCIEEQNKDSSGNITTKYYSCTISVNCVINGRDITPNFTVTSFQKLVKDQKIKLYYDPNDITNINIYQDNYHFWGWLLIILSIILILTTATWAFIVHRSKFAAAVGGGAEGVNIIGNVLGGLFGRR